MAITSPAAIRRSRSELSRSSCRRPRWLQRQSVSPKLSRVELMKLQWNKVLFHRTPWIFSLNLTRSVWLLYQYDKMLVLQKKKVLKHCFLTILRHSKAISPRSFVGLLLTCEPPSVRKHTACIARCWRGLQQSTPHALESWTDQQVGALRQTICTASRAIIIVYNVV